MWENTIVGVNLGADGPVREIASADEGVCLAVPDRDNDALVVVRATGPGTTTVTYTAAKTGPGRFRVTVRPAEEFEAEPLADPIGPTLAEAVKTFNANFVAGGGNMVARPLTVEELRAALARSLRPSGTDPAGRVGEVADYPELVEAVRTSLETGRMPPGGRMTPSVEELGGGGERVDITLTLPLGNFQFPLPVRVGGVTWAVRERIAATLAAAAADDDLPVETRLKLLRETAAPGTLTAEQTAWLFAALAETADTLAAAGPSDGEKVSREWVRLAERSDTILKTLAEYRVAAPDAATARTLSGYVWPTDGRGEADPPPLTVLKNTAGTAEGLRVLLDAAAVPAPAEEPPRVERQGLKTLADVAPSPADRHRQATASLLDAVRTARPATDEAAQVLLEAAASNDAAVRAAAVEALAGAGG